MSLSLMAAPAFAGVPAHPTSTPSATAFTAPERAPAIRGDSVLTGSGSFVTAPPPLQRVPVQVVAGYIIVQGSIDGQQGFWILDTGASGLMVNTAEVTLSEAPVANATVKDAHGGVNAGQAYAIRNFQWEGITMRDVPAIAMNAQAMAAALRTRLPLALQAKPFLGAIGAAQLEPFLTILDYAKQQVVLVALDSTGRPLAPIPEPTPFAQVPLTLREGRPYVQVTVGDSLHHATEFFLLDSGSDGEIDLNPQLIQRLGIPLHNEYGITLSAAGDTVSTQSGVLDRLAIGAAEYRALDVSLDSSATTDAALGYSVLKSKLLGLNLRALTLSVWNTADTVADVAPDTSVAVRTPLTAPLMEHFIATVQGLSAFFATHKTLYDSLQTTRRWYTVSVAVPIRGRKKLQTIPLPLIDYVTLAASSPELAAVFTRGELAPEQFYPVRTAVVRAIIADWARRQFGSAVDDPESIPGKNALLVQQYAKQLDALGYIPKRP